MAFVFIRIPDDALTAQVRFYAVAEQVRRQLAMQRRIVPVDVHCFRIPVPGQVLLLSAIPPPVFHQGRQRAELSVPDQAMLGWGGIIITSNFYTRRSIPSLS